MKRTLSRLTTVGVLGALLCAPARSEADSTMKVTPFRLAASQRTCLSHIAGPVNDLIVLQDRWLTNPASAEYVGQRYRTLVSDSDEKMKRWKDALLDLPSEKDSTERILASFKTLDELLRSGILGQLKTGAALLEEPWREVTGPARMGWRIRGGR